MTSIPANVQSFSAGNRTGQPKVQTPESKEGFGKVLDRQKTVTPKESSVRSQKQQETATGETVRPQGQNETPQEAEPKEVMQAEGGEMETGETVAGQGQPTETVETTQPTETEIPADGLVENELPEDGLEQVMEVLQSAILQIRDLLMQQLDISPQELEQTMRQEGFTDVQLLQPETVDQLILSVTGAEDSMTLVMDEDLYRSQQAIAQGVREIVRGAEEELKDQGGLDKALESLEGLESHAEDRMIQRPEQPREDFQRENNQEQPDRQSGRTERRETDQTATGQVLYQNYNAQAQSQAVAGQTVQTTAMTETAYVETPDPQQIMNQILDYMKVSVRPESTELNMQLHPENLGTLHIQISAREGVMTAHITATSEAVKTVLENQLAVLRENFQQQDIKVEAIEVTVESHQFESNLEQGRQRNAEEQQGRRPRRRRLDMSGLETGEELTEPEQIAAEMMAANGSSVDYLA